MRLPGPFTLREYALLADGERGALVDPHGNIGWLCAPRWHDPAIFASMLGGRSEFALTPEGRFVWGGYYEPGSMIWRSRWVTETGIVECRSALARPSRRDRLVLLRRIEAVEGEARVNVRLRAGADHDRRAIALRRDPAGGWRGRAGELHVVALGLDQARPRDGLRAQIRLEEGEHHDLVFVAGSELEGPAPDADRVWEETETVWSELAPPLDGTLAPRDARHAVAVLHGLTSPGGGMVAAATMSLPERAGEGENYDYRYVWIRDQCYAGRAAATAGVMPLLDAAIGFTSARLLSDGPRTMPAYTVDGEPVPAQGHADLPGYPGGSDVTGNWVNSQFQLDAFGETLLLFAAGDRHDRLDAEHRRAAGVAARTIEARWREPDAGVWELAPAQWTHSRLVCTAGLRALAGMTGTPGRETARWSSLADTILADCSRRSLHPDGRWQRSPEDSRVDASLLLGALRGAVAAGDPRSRGTLEAVLGELGDDHYLYRYRPDERPLGRAEGAFLLCGLWAALACAQVGHPAAALRWFERARASCGPPGLFSEEYDVRQRQLRGNLPQAFVHAALLECAVTLGHDDDPSEAAK